MQHPLREDAKKVRALAKTTEVIAEVNGDAAFGQMRGLTGTPGIVITHKGHPVTYRGAVSYAILQRTSTAF